MREHLVYLDSSCIVKRYVEEPGSEAVRNVYFEAYSAEASIAYSLWNIGEVLGAFNKAFTRGILTNEDYLTVRRAFLIETRRLVKLGVLNLVHIRLKLLSDCWSLLEKYRIYQADALQIASAKAVNATQLLTADKRVYEVAEAEGLNSTLIA